MRIYQPSRLPKMVTSALTFAAVLTWGATESLASPTFSSTSDASAWQVATNVGGADGLFSSFPTTGFVTAVAATGRTTDGIGWIANNSTGTNGGIGTWTFFVFQQTFDLTGYDAASADLQFLWAADDSGQGFAERGSWTPKFSLNGGSLIDGSWPGGSSYDFSGATQDISSGFVPGLNTIDFYVEGNGVTDGFALEPLSFTANLQSGIPEPESFAVLLAGLGVLGALRRRKAKA